MAYEDETLTIPVTYAQTERFYPACSGLPPSVTWRSYNDTTTHHNLTPEHRPLPADLLSALTARAVQWSQRTSVGLNRKVSTAYFNCGGKTTPYDVVTRTLVGRSTYPVVATPDLWMNALRSKIRNRRFEIAENIGEYREAVRQYPAMANSVKDAFLRFKLSKPKTYRRPGGKVERWDNHRDVRTSDLAAAELAYRFGIKPLALQIKELAQKSANELKVRKFRVSASDNRSEREIVLGRYGGEWKCTRKRSARVVAYFGVKSSFTLVSVGDPLEWVWAAIPYSFVVDWFANVGDTLANMGALSDYQFYGGTVTYRDERRGRDQRIETAGATLERPGVYTYKSQERAVISSIPLPRLAWRHDDQPWLDRLKASVEMLRAHRRW